MPAVDGSVQGMASNDGEVPMKKSRLICRALVLLLVLLFAAGGWAEPNGRETVMLNVGLGRNGFTGINQTDARAALKIFTQSMGRRKGYDLDVTVLTFDSEKELADAITSDSLNLIVVQASYYLQEKLDSLLEPLGLPVESGQGAHEYLLLVGKDSPYQNLGDLRGKRILLFESIICNLSQYWIETVLMDEENEPFDGYFLSARIEHKPSKVILPVFFGQADACVIHRPALDILRELNPQIGRRLRAIEISKPLVDALVCMSKKDHLTPACRKDVIDAMFSIDSDVYGQQILMLFKAEGLVRFKEEDLSNTRALVKKHNELIPKDQAQ